MSEVRAFDYRRCKNCGETAYAHLDHAHNLLSGFVGGVTLGTVRRCPFGDCGRFEPATEVTQ